MNSSTKIPFLIAGLLAVAALNVTANVIVKDMHTQMLSKAVKSQKGVIMVVSDRGAVAADAAFLLSEQVAHNPGYLPLLMVPLESQVKTYAEELGLDKQALPAIIFYDKSGNEIGRVIGTKTVAHTPANVIRKG